MIHHFTEIIEKKTPIAVTCAIIENNGLVLAAQRGSNMKMPFKWEFPGGKIRSGENPEDCLRRELSEELNISVSIHHYLPPSTHAYPDFQITLHPFICSIASGEPKLNEHAAIIWLPVEKLYDLDWAAADLPVLNAYHQWKETVGQ